MVFDETAFDETVFDETVFDETAFDETARNETARDDEEPEWGDAEVERSTICATCGVSSLPAEPLSGSDSICENPSCDAFGEPVDD